MPNIIQTEAIVLRKIELLGQDNMVIFFSKELGKLVCIAKGVKKITSRRASHLQTGNLINLTLHTRGERYYVSQSVVISAFSAIKSNAVKMGLLYKYLFILDRILPEREPEIQLYKEVKREISKLAQAEKVNDSSFLNDFALKAVMYLGYQKEYDKNESVIDQVEGIIHEKIPQHVII